MKELEAKYPRLFFKHKRVTIAHPEGALAHDGDCDLFDVDLQVCTCGLHHSLSPVFADDIDALYPKYMEELEGKSKVAVLMRTHKQGMLWEECDGCKGKGGVAMTPCEQCKGKGVIPFKMPEPMTDEEINEMFEKLRKGFGSQCIITKDGETTIHDSGTIGENEEK